MARKSRIDTLELIAECAGITVRELRELADHEPRLAEVLERYPIGQCFSGIPMRPEEYKKFLRQEHKRTTN